MKPGRSGATSLLLAIVVVFAVLSYALLRDSGDRSIREKTSSDPYSFLPDMGGVPPTGSIKGVIGLDASIVDSQIRVDGSVPRLYVGGMFYRLYGEDGQMDLDELKSLGIELTDNRPFVLVELTIETVQGESGPAEGSARIVSIDKVEDHDITAAIIKLVSDFSDRTDDLTADIELARLVLDPEMYNSDRTILTCTYAGDGLNIVLDMQVDYEGPLDWNIVPYHLALASYLVDEDGGAKEVTLVAPRVASKVSKGLNLVLLADTGTTRAGEEIRFMMALKNVGEGNYTAKAGPPLFDLALYRKGGGSMGSWSTGKGFPEYVESITLQPGEVLRQTIMWDLMPLDPESGFPVQMVTGSYEVATVWVPEDLESDGLPIWINASRPSMSLTWIKSGGFAGVNEELTISPEGDVLVTNRANLEKSALRLSPDEHWKLFEHLDQLGLMELDWDDHGAAGGAADFFSYDLDLMLEGSGRKMKWVDHWASEVPLPDALFESGSVLEELAKRVWSDGAPLLD
jgi:hypothetical protein